MQPLSREEIGAHYDRHEAHRAASLPPERRQYERERFIDQAVQWRQRETERGLRHQQIAAAVFRHLDASSLPLQDWPERIREAAAQFQRIIDRGAHPDDVDLARAGMSALAGIWLTPGEVEDLFVFGTSTPEVPVAPPA